MAFLKVSGLKHTYLSMNALRSKSLHEKNTDMHVFIGTYHCFVLLRSNIWNPIQFLNVAISFIILLRKPRQNRNSGGRNDYVEKKN